MVRARFLALGPRHYGKFRSRQLKLQQSYLDYLWKRLRVQPPGTFHKNNKGTYLNISTVIAINGALSKLFKIHRGKRTETRSRSEGNEKTRVLSKLLYCQKFSSDTTHLVLLED